MPAWRSWSQIRGETVRSIYSNAIDGDLGSVTYVDPLTGAFIDSCVGGRSKERFQACSAERPGWRKLFSQPLLDTPREGCWCLTDLSAWLSGEECIPTATTVRHLEMWLKTTKASVVVWSHRGSGAEVVDPKGQTTSLRPRALHLGIREGNV